MASAEVDMPVTEKTKIEREAEICQILKHENIGTRPSTNHIPLH